VNGISTTSSSVRFAIRRPHIIHDDDDDDDEEVTPASRIITTTANKRESERVARSVNGISTTSSSVRFAIRRPRIIHDDDDEEDVTLASRIIPTTAHTSPMESGMDQIELPAPGTVTVLQNISKPVFRGYNTNRPELRRSEHSMDVYDVMPEEANVNWSMDEPRIGKVTENYQRYYF